MREICYWPPHPLAMISIKLSILESASNLEQILLPNFLHASLAIINSLSTKLAHLMAELISRLEKQEIVNRWR
jgi:hypothetical protein